MLDQTVVVLGGLGAILVAVTVVDWLVDGLMDEIICPACIDALED